jgi:hypothetical protein
LEKDFESISIVGSRKISNYGKTVTSEFASYFAKKGVTIVSGLARGVDTLAHITALENKSRTIAVLGNGLLVNYPPENKKLQEVIAQNGAVISEFHLKQPPDKRTFPRRNRIIAGLSKSYSAYRSWDWKRGNYNGKILCGIRQRCFCRTGKHIFKCIKRNKRSYTKWSLYSAKSAKYGTTAWVACKK